MVVVRQVSGLLVLQIVRKPAQNPQREGRSLFFSGTCGSVDGHVEIGCEEPVVKNICPGLISVGGNIRFFLGGGVLWNFLFGEGDSYFRRGPSYSSNLNRRFGLKGIG